MIFIVVLFTVLAIWYLGYLRVNDNQVPKFNAKDFSSLKKVLVIFPHADDEVFSCAGLMWQFRENGVEVVWVVLTRGERGNEKAEYDEDLGNVRVQEAARAAKIYRVELIQKKLPDYELENYLLKLKKTIQKIIDDQQPELIITYDHSGLYGHPDHIVTSEVVTEIANTNANIKLWYVTLPRKTIKTLKLPEHMAHDPEFKSKQTLPNTRFNVGASGVLVKISALLKYQSQLPTIQKGMPYDKIPAWVYILFMPNEYFHRLK